MYAVIGANGFLGSYMIKNILEYTQDRVIATTRSFQDISGNERVEWVRLDVTDRSDVESLHQRFRDSGERVKMVYLAAFHHPDQVEADPQRAWDINVTALSAFMNCMAEDLQCAFYASTDSVYGESANGYHFGENDCLDPVNTYGHNKCAAEAVMVHRGFHVVRFPFLISPSLCSKQHFYDVIVNTLREGNTMDMFADSYRSSLSFDNAARLLVALMEMNTARIPHILNVCGDADLSKYDVGKMIAEREGLRKELIVPVGMQEQKREGFETRRAQSTLMDNSLLKKTLGLEKVDIFEPPVWK